MENNNRLSDIDALKRRMPLNKDEMWPQKLPVFPIHELKKCFEDFNVSTPNGTAFDFYIYLLRQSKTDEQEEKDLFNRLMYASIDDINFGRWLNENHWQPYDGNDRWINLNSHNNVKPITELFAEYKYQFPNP
jgi:hypothetical protein